MARTTAEDDQTDQERQSQFALDSGRTYSRAFFVHGNGNYTFIAALAMFPAATGSSLLAKYPDS
jgi:hypothetical protein